MKRVTPIVTAVIALTIFSSGATGKNQSRAEKIERCKAVPSTIAERRQATWGWEKELEVKKTPTEYVERTASSCKYLRYVKHKWSMRADKKFELVKTLERSPTAAIRWVFGPTYDDQAINVSWCESRHSLWAENGQYLGLFQMGSSERRIFGHGNTAVDQARAAERYFIVSGRDWSPWSCKPW